MRRQRFGVPAVVVGGDTNALGVVRSLARGGIATWVIDADPSQPALHSRFTTPVVVPSITGTALIVELLRLAERFERRLVLFPTADVHVSTVSALRQQLARSYHVDMPDHDVITRLLHKSSIQALAETLGVPIPRAVAIRTVADLESLRTLAFPAIVKPALQQHIRERRVARNYRVATREEADAACRRMLAHSDDLIVQEWIEGDDTDIYFCLQYRTGAGETLASFTGRKLRSWPPQRGNTASCMPAPEVEGELETLTSRFFDAVQFSGLGGLEFKRDRRTGRFLLIEPTVGRTDAQEEVATLNGVNIALVAYCHQLGLELPAPRKPSAPVVWRNSVRYWQSVIATRSWRQAAHGSDNGSPSGRQGPHYTVISAVWRRDDPRPFLFFLLRRLRKLTRLSWWRRLWAPHRNAALWTLLNIWGH